MYNDKKKKKITAISFPFQSRPLHSLPAWLSLWASFPTVPQTDKEILTSYSRRCYYNPLLNKMSRELRRVIQHCLRSEYVWMFPPQGGDFGVSLWVAESMYQARHFHLSGHICVRRERRCAVLAFSYFLHVGLTPFAHPSFGCIPIYLWSQFLSVRWASAETWLTILLLWALEAQRISSCRHLSLLGQVLRMSLCLFINDLSGFY